MSLLYHLHLDQLHEGNYGLTDNDGLGEAEELGCKLDTVLHGLDFVVTGVEQDCLV